MDNIPEKLVEELRKLVQHEARKAYEVDQETLIIPAAMILSLARRIELSQGFPQ